VFTTPLFAVATGSVDSNSVTTAGQNTTNADLLVVAVADESGVTATVSDSRSNTWTARGRSSNATGNLQLFDCVPTNKGTGTTFTATSTGAFPAIAVLGWAGSKTTGAPLDQQNGAASDAASALSTGSITPGETDELVIAAAGTSTAANTINSVDSGFTIAATAQVSGTADGVSIAWKVQTAIAALSATWTYAGANTAAVRIASFKAAPGGATGNFLGFF
jgi:hypothetical protein